MVMGDCFMGPIFEAATSPQQIQLLNAMMTTPLHAENSLNLIITAEFLSLRLMAPKLNLC
jgi:hypothetical protein